MSLEPLEVLFLLFVLSIVHIITFLQGPPAPGEAPNQKNVRK